MLYLNSINETFSDFPDPVSLAVVASFYGCIFNCKGCQNPSLQKKDPNYAVSWDVVFNGIRDYCNRCLTKKVVLSGGDPFCLENEKDLKDMLFLINELQANDYEVCVYTGSTIEAIEGVYRDCSLMPPKYVKCGSYQEDLRDEDMGKTDSKFVLASKNQAFYESFSDSDKNYHFKKISQNNVLNF